MKNIIIVILFYIISATIGYYFLDNNKEEKNNFILDNQIEILDTYYNILKNNQKEDADNAFKELSTNKIILKSLEEINSNLIENNLNKDLTEEKSKIIYKELFQKYELLLNKGLFQYQIILPNNISLLRMNNPTNEIIDISNIRKDFVFVNETKKIVRGFSQGNISYAFRNIYPIFYNNKYLGAVEISFSTNYLQNYLNNISNIHTHFIIDKNEFFSNNIKKDFVEKQYLESAENNNYLLSMTEIHSKEKCIDSNNYLFIKYKDFINNNMLKDKKFSFYIKDNFYIKTKIISFFPIENNINNKTAAWIVSYNDSNILDNVLYYDSLFKLIMFSSLFIVSWILYFLLSSKEYMEKTILEKTRNLQKINRELLKKDLELEKLNKTLEDKVIIQSEEQQMLLSLFDKGLSIVFKWRNDENWSVEYVSKGVKDLLGYTPFEFYKKQIHYKDCIFVNDLVNVKEEVATNLDNDFIKHKPYKIITKDGEIKWVSDFTLVIHDEFGNIKYFLGYINDITDEIKRTEIINQKSRLASMGEMIGNIAHQWRQPLSIITTAASGIKLQKEMDIYNYDNLPNDMDAIVKSGLYLSQTIDDFKDFIKGDSKKENFILCNSIDNFLEIVNGSIKSIYIDVIKEFDYSIEIYGCKTELNQCLLNLFNNSKDVIQDLNEKIISIKTYSNEKYAFIEFIDNGGGISSNVISKIFEPYFTTKHKSQGTGLGLNMTYQLITQSLQGDIYVENTSFTHKNKQHIGAKFTIKLPLKKNIDYLI